MKASDLVTEKLILFLDEQLNKKELLKRISTLFDKTYLNDQNELFQAFCKREEEISTGIGFGIAIPHARFKGIKKPAIAFIKTNRLIDYNSLDGLDVDIIIAIIVPFDASSVHLGILAMLASKLADETFRYQLRNLQNKEEVLKLLSLIEDKNLFYYE